MSTWVPTDANKQWCCVSKSFGRCRWYCTVFNIKFLSCSVAQRLQSYFHACSELLECTIIRCKSYWRFGRHKELFIWMISANYGFSGSTSCNALDGLSFRVPGMQILFTGLSLHMLCLYCLRMAVSTVPEDWTRHMYSLPHRRLASYDIHIGKTISVFL